MRVLTSGNLTSGLMSPAKITSANYVNAACLASLKIKSDMPGRLTVLNLARRPWAMIYG